MKKNSFIELTARSANVSYEAAEDRMTYIEHKYGISYETFYRESYYFMTESQIAALVKDARLKEAEDEEFMDLVAADTGQSVRKIKSTILEIKKLTDYTVSFQQYYDYRLDLLGSIDGLALVRRLRDRDILLERVRKDISKMVEIDLNAISVEMHVLQAMLPLSISSRTRMEILAQIKASVYDVPASELNDLIEDIEFMHLMFEFSYEEYFTYGFSSKPLGERVKYLSKAEQQRYLSVSMDPFQKDVLTTDWKSHDVLKDYVTDGAPSANLVEIFTCNMDGEAFLQSPCVMNKDKEIQALVDYDAGTIMSNGQQIPKWDELTSLCQEIGDKLTKVYCLGLICAFSREQKWFLYDIDCEPDSVTWQALSNSGHRYGFLNYFLNPTLAVEGSKMTNGISYKAVTSIADNTSKSVTDSGSYGIYQRTIRKEIDEEKLYRAENSIIYKKLEEEEDISHEEADQYISRIKEATGYDISLKRFAEHKMYSLSDEKMISLAETLKKRHDLVVKIRSSIPKIDKGLMTFADLNDDIEELRHLFEITLTEEFFNSAKELIYESPYRNGLTGTEFLRIIVDARMTRAIFGFSIIEYIMYNFKDKSIEERDSFIGNPERAYWTKLVNDTSESRIMDNKFLAYRNLSEYYGRAIINIKSDNDYEMFAAFVSKVHEFFYKPASGINGINVRYVMTHSQTDTKALFNRIRSISDDVVIEEAIRQSDVLEIFNRDSVNTVRIITFNNNGNIRPMFGLFRAGRMGSHIDVGRAGGTMVDIDIKTGKLASDGVDIHGARFEFHPDTGVRYQGFQLPDWQQVINLSIELAGKFPKVRYAFWDFAYNRDGDWVLMDCTSQDLMVNQAASGRGCRAEFLKAVEEVIKPDETNQDAPGSILKTLTSRFKK